jgi:hypothetical protein
MSDVTGWQDLHNEYSRQYGRGETDSSFEGWLMEQTLDARDERRRANELLNAALALAIAVSLQQTTSFHVRLAGELVQKIEALS